MKKILYVGGFILPDKNAAAQRVINNAKAIRKNGNEVIFVNYSNSCKEATIKYYFDFKCYEYPERSIFETICFVNDILKILEIENISDIILYNYPLIGMWRIMNFCKKKNIKCIGDVTEWYVGNHGFFYNILKNIESNVRMKYLNNHLDSMIVISNYLYEYYKSKNEIIKIPPLVDASDEKWEINKKYNPVPVFCFVGNVNKQKERLDYVVKNIEKIDKKIQLKFKIVGISKDDFIKHYGYEPKDERICFLGKLENKEAISVLKNSDWSILIKDINLVTTAGFPTKVAESITANVPIIANEFSDIFSYLNNTNSIKIELLDDLSNVIIRACNTKKEFDNLIFDYNNYLTEFKKII